MFKKIKIIETLFIGFSNVKVVTRKGFRGCSFCTKCPEARKGAACQEWVQESNWGVWAGKQVTDPTPTHPPAMCQRASALLNTPLPQAFPSAFPQSSGRACEGATAILILQLRRSQVTQLAQHLTWSHWRNKMKNLVYQLDGTLRPWSEEHSSNLTIILYRDSIPMYLRYSDTFYSPPPPVLVMTY